MIRLNIIKIFLLSTLFIPSISYAENYFQLDLWYSLSVMSESKSTSTSITTNTDGNLDERGLTFGGSVGRSINNNLDIFVGYSYFTPMQEKGVKLFGSAYTANIDYNIQNIYLGSKYYTSTNSTYKPFISGSIGYATIDMSSDLIKVNGTASSAKLDDSVQNLSYTLSTGFERDLNNQTVGFELRYGNYGKTGSTVKTSTGGTIDQKVDPFSQLDAIIYLKF